MNRMSPSERADALETRLAGATNRIAEGARVARTLSVSTMAAGLGAVVDARLGSGPDKTLSVMGLPVVPAIGVALGVGALMGWGGKASRQTLLAASVGMTSGYVYNKVKSIAG